VRRGYLMRRTIRSASTSAQLSNNDRDVLVQPARCARDMTCWSIRYDKQSEHSRISFHDFERRRAVHIPSSESSAKTSFGVRERPLPEMNLTERNDRWWCIYGETTTGGRTCAFLANGPHANRLHSSPNPRPETPDRATSEQLTACLQRCSFKA
jgi:hypothetical protein